MSKKLVLFITLIFIVSTLILSITAAFITKEMNSNNIITFGNIKIESNVTTENNNKEEKINNGDSFDITYNSNINRNVQVKNVGDHPAFIRVSFELIGETKQNEIVDIKSLVEIKQKDKNWQYKEGWYYYTQELQSKKETTKLSAFFEFDIDEITAKYPGISITLDINVEAVQAENNNSIFEAEGWPTN